MAKYKKPKRRILYSRRTFLNPTETIAIIKARVEIFERDTNIEVDASLVISDCANNIHLDFDIYESSVTKKYLRERRKKVALLRKIINDFLDAVDVGYDEIEEKAPAKAAEVKRQKQELKKKKK